MDKYVNPPEFLAEQKAKAEELENRERRFPDYPRKDVLTFVLEHAPLESWQQAVLEGDPRRGLLLRAPAPDEDHERGLGHLLALADDDGEHPRRHGDLRLRERPRRHPGQRAGSAQSLQAGGRALP